MEKIKNYVLPEHTNTLYEKEASSSIGLTRDIAAKINELINAYNELSEMDLKWKQTQEGTIRKGVIYMKDNLINSLEQLMDMLLKNGFIDGRIDEQTKALNASLAQLVGKLKEGSTTMDAEIIDARVDESGKVHNSLGEAIRTLSAGTTQFRKIDNPEAYHNLTSNLVKDGSYSCTASKWKDLPENQSCTLLVFTYSGSYVLQIAINYDTGKMFTRVISKADHSIYREWSATSGSIGGVPQFRHVENSEDYDRLTSKLVEDGYYSCTYSRWDDLPGGNCALLVFRYSTNYVVQLAVEYESGSIFSRIVNRNDFSIYRDWNTSNDYSNVKILAVGDSICYGARNGTKGFIGDLGLAYKNDGLSGATLSNHRSDVLTVGDQLVNAEYDPDVIIANGGINDYTRSAPMGTIPTKAITTDAECDKLDRTTAMGGLQYLLYKMITKYPSAQRFFLLSHKTKKSTGIDCTTTPNEQGYTQTDLFNAIKTVCALYNVQIIDVFGQSVINTNYDIYRSPVEYSEDQSVTDEYFVDYDGVHPLAYGYTHGYVPIVRAALSYITRK